MTLVDYTSLLKLPKLGHGFDFTTVPSMKPSDICRTRSLFDVRLRVNHDLGRIIGISRPSHEHLMVDHFVPTTRNEPSTISEAMEIHIRKAGVEDLKHILYHRRAMFEEMGFADSAVLDRVGDLSRKYFEEALRIGTYRAWLAEELNGHVVGGGGIVVAGWPGYPGENHAERVWILNMYTEPGARRCGVAKRLLEVMIEWCRIKGFSAVSLHASSAGRPLYETVGFQQTNEMMLKLQ
jgi:GNAT superfamily N-acetyltransferase